VIGVDDEERHRSHFAAREGDERGRLATRYVEGFEGIRRLQRYVKSQALAHGVPVIPNHGFDQSMAAVIDLVMERATERLGLARVAPPATAVDRGPSAEERDPHRGQEQGQQEGQKEGMQA
jgi:2-phosphoglycerate kinase